MRVKRVRLDLFICMLISGVIFSGLWYVGEKFGLMEKALDAVGEQVDVTKEVDDGQVGGYPTEETVVVTTLEEMRKATQENKLFTVKTRTVKYANYGTFFADNHDWNILCLEDDNAIAVKLNTRKIQKSGERDEIILPVGKVILQTPPAMSEMREMLADTDYKLVPDAYIDMDGEAQTTYVNPSMQAAMIIITILTEVLPFLLFVLYILSVFWVHSFFVKAGIFPPVFPRREKSEL